MPPPPQMNLAQPVSGQALPLAVSISGPSPLPASTPYAVAEQTARRYVLEQQPDEAVDASADPETMVVTVRLHVPPTLLHPPGQPTVEVTADGTAHPFVGQAAAEP